MRSQQHKNSNSNSRWKGHSNKYNHHNPNHRSSKMKKMAIMASAITLTLKFSHASYQSHQTASHSQQSSSSSSGGGGSAAQQANQIPQHRVRTSKRILAYGDHPWGDNANTANTILSNNNHHQQNNDDSIGGVGQPLLQSEKNRNSSPDVGLGSPSSSVEGDRGSTGKGGGGGGETDRGLSSSTGGTTGNTTTTGNGDGDSGVDGGEIEDTEEDEEEEDNSGSGEDSTSYDDDTDTRHDYGRDAYEEKTTAPTRTSMPSISPSPSLMPSNDNTNTTLCGNYTNATSTITNSTNPCVIGSDDNEEEEEEESDNSNDDNTDRTTTDDDGTPTTDDDTPTNNNPDRTLPQPIRIHAHYTQHQSSGLSFLSPRELQLLQDSIITPATKSWENILSLSKGVVGNLTIEKDQLFDDVSCGPGLDSDFPSVVVPLEHFDPLNDDNSGGGHGVPDTDLLVYVSVAFYVPEVGIRGSSTTPITTPNDDDRKKRRKKRRRRRAGVGCFNITDPGGNSTNPGGNTTLPDHGTLVDCTTTSSSTSQCNATNFDEETTLIECTSDANTAVCNTTFFGTGDDNDDEGNNSTEGVIVLDGNTTNATNGTNTTSTILTIGENTLIECQNTFKDCNATLVEGNTTLMDCHSTLTDCKIILIDDNNNSTLIDGNTTSPVDDDDIDGNTTSPVDDDDIDGNTTAPVDDDDIDGNTTAPVDDDDVDGNTTAPVDDDDGNNTTPGDGNSTDAVDGDSTTPVDDGNRILVDDQENKSITTTTTDDNTTLVGDNESTVSDDGNTTLVDGNNTLIDSNTTLTDNSFGCKSTTHSDCKMSVIGNSTLVECQSTLTECNSTTLSDGNSTLVDGNNTLTDGNRTIVDCTKSNSTDCNTTLVEEEEDLEEIFFDCNTTLADCNTTTVECNTTLADCNTTLTDGNNTLSDCNTTLTGCNETIADDDVTTGPEVDDDKVTPSDDHTEEEEEEEEEEEDDEEDEEFFDECNTTLDDEFLEEDDYIEEPVAPTCTGSYLASATYCSTDQHDRPIAGMLHICITPDFFNPVNAPRHIATAIHELGHILGFNSQSLAHFRDPKTGVPLTPRDENGDVPDVEVVCSGDTITGRGVATIPLPSENIMKFDYTRGVRVANVVTPTVKQVVRNHFDCQSLEGAEMESGSIHTTGLCLSDHWERRLFKGDIMNPIMDDVTSPTFISPLTAAYFRDSGWYEVNLARVKNADAWGRSAGCDFVTKQCLTTSSDVSSTNAPFFCSAKTDTRGCSVDWSRKADCLTVDYDQNLPPEYQYFQKNPLLGGIDKYIDYCPLWEPLERGLCKDLSNAPSMRVSRMEEFGIVNSRCVSGQVDGDQNALCVPIACVMDERKLKLRIDGYWKNCDYAGQRLESWWDNQDYVTCPDPHRLCPTFFCQKNCLGAKSVGLCDYEQGTCLCPETFGTLGDIVNDLDDDMYDGNPMHGDTGNEDDTSGGCKEEEINSPQIAGAEVTPIIAEYYFSTSDVLEDDEKDILDHTVRMFTKMSVGEFISFTICSLIGVVASIIIVSFVFKVVKQSRSGSLVRPKFIEFLSQLWNNREWQVGTHNGVPQSGRQRNKQKMVASVLVNLRMEEVELEHTENKTESEINLDKSAEKLESGEQQNHTTPHTRESIQRSIYRSELPPVPNNGRVLSIVGVNFVDDHLVPFQEEGDFDGVAITEATVSDDTSTHLNLESCSIQSTRNSVGNSSEDDNDDDDDDTFIENINTDEARPRLRFRGTR